jgi:hypothetical protein
VETTVPVLIPPFVDAIAVTTGKHVGERVTTSAWSANVGAVFAPFTEHVLVPSVTFVGHALAVADGDP